MMPFNNMLQVIFGAYEVMNIHTIFNEFGSRFSINEG